MDSRERLRAALGHKPCDRVCVDFGGTAVTSMHVSCVAALRERLGLEKRLVKVNEPLQMLGQLDDDLLEALEIDTAAVIPRNTMFGFANEAWKGFRLPWGQEVLVPGGFNVTEDSNGDLLIYPQSDTSARPSGRMPKKGFYFDSIIRQEPIDEEKLDPKDNLEEFGPISDEGLKHFRTEVKRLESCGRGIVAAFGGTAFGDIAKVPAPFLKNPKGIRDIEEWYVSTVTRKDYIKEVFRRQAEIALENLKRIFEAVGNGVDVVLMDGTDLAAQNTLFCGPETYRDLYMPYAKKLNDWIHGNTEWKTMKHCCGGCEPLIDGFIEAGYDILNPLQCSAKGMAPEMLVEKYGERIVFWGGGVDTQHTLAFGRPDEVAAEVAERVRIFSRKSGFVFNAVHNIQYNTPIENILAIFKALGRDVPT